MEVNNLNIITTDWNQYASELTRIRKTVFVDEQHVPIEMELDESDQQALHFLVFSDDAPIATARLLPNGHVGRMAVLKPYRGKSVGLALLNTIIDTARNSGLNELFLNAQTSAIAFYEKFGFIQEGETFLDAGIQHIRMRKTL